MMAIELIKWVFPHALVRKEMSNDRALLSIIEQGGQGLHIIDY
jgi:hypothetical protein